MFKSLFALTLVALSTACSQPEVQTPKEVYVSNEILETCKEMTATVNKASELVKADKLELSELDESIITNYSAEINTKCATKETMSKISDYEILGIEFRATHIESILYYQVK